jgi:hypothetical protein
MRYYDSIPRVQDDGTLLGNVVWAFNKLDGQNLGVRYSAKRKEFINFVSRHRQVDENDEQFGEAVRYFKEHYPNVLLNIIKENSGKKGIFNGAQELMFFFEWCGEHSFAGFHNPEDKLDLYLIDVFISKKGYIEPEDFYDMFCTNDNILTPELIYHGVLTKDFITSINKNDWTKEGCQYPTVKEGVVCRNTRILKGQRMPKCKFKTQWWLNKLHEKFSEEECKKLE